MTEGLAKEDSSYLQHLRSSRNSPAVLKARLIAFRSAEPKVTIVALEGDDDKIVYSQWVARVRPDFVYEPFPCGGKRGVLSLKAVVERDLGNLRQNLYFLIDRDFDDLAGHPSSDAVFLTDRYSIENYLVDRDVLKSLLKNEFHCHERPDIRKIILDLFERDYEAFLKITRMLNFRIYVARRLEIELNSALPTKLNVIANIDLGVITPSDTLPEEVVVYSREPQPMELEALEAEFAKLEPRTRFRGKFALKFFQRWLERLGDEYRAGTRCLFSELSGNARPRAAELVLSNFASKSKVPNGFTNFINSVAESPLPD